MAPIDLIERPTPNLSGGSQKTAPSFLDCLRRAFEMLPRGADASLRDATTPEIVRCGGNIREPPVDKTYVTIVHSRLLPTSGMRRVAGWGLVRTHAAGAARALPSPASPRPLGASLLACRAAPEAELLGAFASRSRSIGGAGAIS